METKHHYRSLAKSDHLGVADLEDMIEKNQSLIFKIKEVKQQLAVAVAGRKGDHNICYFEGSTKPWVINSTNGKVIAKLTKSPFLEDWSGILIELFIDPNVKLMNELTGGVRVRPKLPVIKKPVLTLDHPRYDAAKTAWLDGKKDGVRKQFEISDELIKSFEDGI